MVDKRLVKLAQRLKAKLITVDFNLNKVATAAGVQVLNVNTLATDLRTTLLPGETLKIKVTSNGKDPSQGVGYLLDGTMIVVEKCGDKIGQEVQIEVTRVLQTAAGKMFFGKLV